MLGEKSCGAIVYLKKGSETLYLMLHYEAGHWDFVKGNVEEGESDRETALRELKEETGIADARFLGGFREKISYFYKRQGATVYKEVVFFLMEAKNMNVKLSFEHVAFDWLTKGQLLSLPMFVVGIIMFSLAYGTKIKQLIWSIIFLF